MKNLIIIYMSSISLLRKGGGISIYLWEFEDYCRIVESRFYTTSNSFENFSIINADRYNYVKNAPQAYTFYVSKEVEWKKI